MRGVRRTWADDVFGGHLFFKECEAGICCRCLLPLFLADRLKAALEVLFLLVECFSPAFHVLGNLNNITFKLNIYNLTEIISKATMSYIPSDLTKKIMIPAEQSCFWASLFSPWVLWALWHLQLRYHLAQCYFLLGLERMSASHCPSTDTAGSEDCSNTDTSTNVHVKTKLGLLGHSKTWQEWKWVQYIHGSLGHSRNQFENHSNIQRTHHIDNWMYQELSKIIRRKHDCITTMYHEQT